MISIFTIWTVALYEVKTLFRSWFFRIFSILALGILIMLNTGLFASERVSIWALRGISSSIPYMNLMLLNVVQAVIGIFMASDFLKYDKKLDSTEVIYTRSMTNAEYVLGKSLGVFIVFISLNALILLMSLIFNVFFADVPLVPAGYIYYPLFISIPTLTFIFGLSFLCMVVFRSQAITFILLLGYIAGTIFFLGNTFHYLFDYMAFNVPLIYSDFVGFGDMSTILIHRGIYLLLGFGFIFLTVILLKRLSQSPFITYASFFMAILCIGAAIYLGNMYLSRIYSGRTLRKEMTALNARLADEPYISITGSSLDLSHQEKEIEVTADIRFKNNTASPLKTYIFSLNPGLKITSVTNNGKNIGFERNLHILTVEPQVSLQPGQADSLTIHYRGSINEDACYVDIDEEKREEDYGLFVYSIDKHFSFITPQYVLLTHENLWYPVAGIPYGSAYPRIKEMDFINFDLRVETDPELTACSQGSVLKSEDGEFIFKTDEPLPQISLAIGKYEKRSINVDNVDYNLFVLEGHDYFSPYVNMLGEALPEIITESKQDYERKMDMSYPFNRLSLIEVPIQFFAYSRTWTLSHQTVQPEQVLLPEKGILLLGADFKQMHFWMSRGGRGDRGGSTRTPEEIQSDILRRFVQTTFINDSFSRGIMNIRRGNSSGSGFSLRNILSGLIPSSIPSYGVFPNFYSFTNHFSSNDWPIFNLSLEHYLKSRLEDQGGGFPHFAMGLSNEELANIALSKQNLSEIIVDPEKKDILYDVLKNKADYIFAGIKAELGKDIFDDFLIEYLENNRFKDLNALDFLDTLRLQFNFDLVSHFDQWYTEKRLPAFIISGLNCTEVLDGESTRFQVVFTAYNPESVDGIFSASFITGGGGGGGGGPGRMFGMGGPSVEPEEFYFNLNGNEAKEFGILLDEQPGIMRLNTFTSQNLPSVIEKNFEIPKIDDDAEIFEGVRVLDNAPVLVESGEIIVDNEDPGFELVSQQEASFLKKALNINNNEEEEYIGFNFWHPPAKWRATVLSDFYGEYRNSASFIKSGNGEQKAFWKGNITDSGRYDIYYYTSSFSSFGRMMRGGHGRRGGAPIADLNFLIYHDDGTDDITLDVGDAETGWAYLGTYYLSEGTAQVELSDKSKGRIVYADAVKWVKKR